MSLHNEQPHDIWNNPYWKRLLSPHEFKRNDLGYWSATWSFNGDPVYEEGFSIFCGLYSYDWTTNIIRIEEGFRLNELPPALTRAMVKRVENPLKTHEYSQEMDTPSQGLFFINDSVAVMALDVVDAVEKYFVFTGSTYEEPVKVRCLMGSIGFFHIPNEKYEYFFIVKKIEGKYVIC